jgi:hypothetical protein
VSQNSWARIRVNVLIERLIDDHKETILDLVPGRQRPRIFVAGLTSRVTVANRCSRYHRITARA